MKWGIIWPRKSKPLAFEKDRSIFLDFFAPQLRRREGKFCIGNLRHPHAEQLDLDQAVSIRYQGNEIAQKVFERTTINLHTSPQERGDPAMVFSVKIGVSQNNSLIE